MLSTDAFLSAVQSAEKTDWRYNQLPQYAKDYIDTLYIRIEELLKEEKKVIKTFNKIKLPIKKLNEEAVRACFVEEVNNQKAAKIRNSLIDLIDYFNNTFDLSISQYKLLGDYQLSDEKMAYLSNKSNFLKAYFTEGNITNINEAGEEKMIKDFQKMIETSCWDKDRNYRMKISNGKIKFEGIMWYNNIWNDGRVDYEGKKRINGFLKAISWFENDLKKSDPECFISVFYEDDQKGIPYFTKIDLNPNFFSKIKALKAYKNGSLDVYFASDEVKEQFLRTFKVNYPPTPEAMG